MIVGIAAAIAFLTRLRIGRAEFDQKDVARAARWFPLVGAMLGAIYAGIYFVLTRVFPSLITATILVGADAWITGALHLDGLADTADGFGGGRTREEVFRIMRDHAIGAYGALALIIVVVLKIATIAALIDSHCAISALVMAPVLGRWASVLLSATQPYARPVEHDHPRSVGSPARFVGRIELMVATVTALLIAISLGGWRGAAGCGLVIAGTVLWGWRCRLRIGGITGDTLGAGIAMSECLVFLLLKVWP